VKLINIRRGLSRLYIKNDNDVYYVSLCDVNIVDGDRLQLFHFILSHVCERPKYGKPQRLARVYGWHGRSHCSVIDGCADYMG